MKGILNSSCVWRKKESVNKYNEITYSSPATIPCAVGKDIKYKQTELGLVKIEEKYYILHSAGAELQDGDTLDGQIVLVGSIKDTMGQIAYYKAVVVDG
jgi:hypothetical protein